jgi:hypothetical protein
MDAAIYAAALGVAIGTTIALVAKGFGYGKKSSRDNGSKGRIPERKSDGQCVLPPKRDAPTSDMHERRLRSRRKRPR